MYECCRVAVFTGVLTNELGALRTFPVSPGINTRLGTPEFYHLVQATWPLEPLVNCRPNPDHIFISALHNIVTYFSISFPIIGLVSKVYTSQYFVSIPYIQQFCTEVFAAYNFVLEIMVILESL
jgi:hypothetical protein